MSKPLPQTKQDMAYKGYLILHTLTGEVFIEKDGHAIGYATGIAAGAVEHAKGIIDQLTAS